MTLKNASTHWRNLSTIQETWSHTLKWSMESPRENKDICILCFNQEPRWIPLFCKNWSTCHCTRIFSQSWSLNVPISYNYFDCHCSYLEEPYNLSMFYHVGKLYCSMYDHMAKLQHLTLFHVWSYGLKHFNFVPCLTMWTNLWKS